MTFPKKLFVKICDDGSSNKYFDPHRAVDTMVDAGEREPEYVEIAKSRIERVTK